MKTQNIYIVKDPNGPKKITLNNQYIANFYIIEDLESMFMTAQIEIEDKGGWVEKFPILGNEVFEIEIIQENDTDKSVAISKKIEFEIYDISLILGVNGKTNYYTFQLIERGFFNSLGSCYSISYKDKKISDIVKDIFKNQMKFNELGVKYEVEDTSGNLDFIIPFWKPSTSIKYLKRIAKRAKDPQDAGFVFFSSFKDKNVKTTIKQFTSLSTLLEQKPENAENEKYYLRYGDKPISYINNIIEVRNPSFMNRSALKNGIKGRSYYGIDFHKDKKFLKESVKLSKYSTKAVFLGETNYFTKDLDDDNSEVEFKGFFDKALLKSEIEYNFRMDFEGINKREILLNGYLNRWVGKIIHITEASGHSDEIMNTNLSGSWMIKKIVHYWVGSAYEQKVTIIKNSFGSMESKETPNNMKASRSNN